MRTLPVIIFLLTTLSSLTAQEFTSSKNTLLELNAIIDSDVMDKLDAYSPISEREKDKLKESKDYLDARVTEIFLNAIYTELADSKNIPLESKDAIRDFVTYGNDGLPNVLIPKAVIKKLGKKGYETDYYFSFSLNVDIPVLAKTNKFSGRVKPEYRCTIKVFDEDRAIVKKSEFKQKTKEPLLARDFPKRKFDKLEKDYIDLLVEEMKPLLGEAIKQTVAQI